jgi:hypothetical protein
MGTELVRLRWERLGWLLATLATACVGRGPSVATPKQPPDFPYASLDPRNATPSEPVGPASCPVPPLVESAYDLAGLSLFSRTLFYLRENHPQDVDSRARDLLVKALEAIAVQDSEIRVERDLATPPGWAVVTVAGQQCRLNIERVDAPWSLRSTLQQAMRFVQGHLAPAPSGEPGQRLMKIEFAATNGMLSALDGHSRLLDAETYRDVRARLPKRSGATTADPGTLRSDSSMDARGAAATPVRAALPRATPGSTVAYLRLRHFVPGVSAEVEQALAALEREPRKGIVIDLRDNTGGLLDEAVKVADAFIKEGTLGSTATKRERKDLVAHSDGHEPTGALVVLVNRQTAAGSELVAAAIKNLGRGVVLGEPTAGAGSIDVMFDLPRTRRHLPSKDRDVVQDILDGAKPSPAIEGPDGEPLGLLLKTGRLLAAGGAEIEGAGVRPDVQPRWPVSEPSRVEDDCLRQFADALIGQARDPQRATLLSTAKTLSAPAACRAVVAPRP